MDPCYWYLCSHTGSALKKEKEEAAVGRQTEMKAREEEEVSTKPTRTSMLGYDSEDWMHDTRMRRKKDFMFMVCFDQTQLQNKKTSSVRTDVTTLYYEVDTLKAGK